MAADTTDFGLQERQIGRKQKLAQMLMEKGQQPLQGHMAGRFYVPPSAWQGLGNIANQVAGGFISKNADAEEKTLGEERKASLVSALKRSREIEKGGATLNSDGTPNMVMPESAPNPQAAADYLLSSQHPTAQQLGVHMLERQGKTADKAQELKAAGEIRASEKEADRAWRSEEAAANRDLRREIASLAAGKKGKLPTAALKLQQEEVDAINAGSTIASDIGALRNQIDTGQLNLGPLDNLMSRARNATGQSNENSRNFGSLEATLERLRNDSLRLNKGVQTEGDAVRAWNELVKDISDPKLVSQRLAQIQALNERAVNLRKLNVDKIRQNYDAGPLDTGANENQPAVVGGGKAQSVNPERAPTGGSKHRGLWSGG